MPEKKQSSIVNEIFGPSKKNKKKRAQSLNVFRDSSLTQDISQLSHLHHESCLQDIQQNQKCLTLKELDLIKSEFEVIETFEQEY